MMQSSHYYTSSSVTVPQPDQQSVTTSTALAPKVVQQMIQSAFSELALLTGEKRKSPIWFVDSGGSKF